MTADRIAKKINSFLCWLCVKGIRQQFCIICDYATKLIIKRQKKEMSERVEKIEYSYDNDFDRKFDEDFRELFTERLKENEDFGCELWSAMANVSWYHEDDPNEEPYRRSFRSAGSLIAVMEGRDKYTKWYCSGPYETVSDYIAEKMASKGWRYKVDGYGPDGDDEPEPDTDGQYEAWV